MAEQARTNAAQGRGRLRRRQILQRGGMTGAGLAAGWALACGRGKSGTTGTPAPAAAGQATAQAKRGGRITFAGGFAGSYDTMGTGFDPATQLQFAARGFTLFYQRLVAYNLVTLATEPEIAQKWEQPSQTEYLFHLQPGINWQNKPPVSGRPLTAEDVIYSLERARSDDPRFTSRSLLSQVDKIEAPDKTSVRITTKGPDAGTLTKLSDENFAVLAKEAVDKSPKLSTGDDAIGTGAFVLQTEEDKVGADYVRNPGYWKQGLPYLDGFRTKHFGDLLTAWGAFVAKQVDVALVPGSEVKGYLAGPGSGSPPDWYGDDTLGLYETPNVKTKPMDDARVPRALRLLMDHDELINAWSAVQFGKGGYGSIFPPALASWDLTDDEYRQQLEWKQPKDDAAKEALSLLAAAGYTKDNPLKFDVVGNNFPQTIPAHQLIQAQWKRLSQGIVDVNLRIVDTATSSALRSSGNFAYMSNGFSVGIPEPDIWLSSVHHSGASLNFQHFSDPQLDAMIDKQRTIFDTTQRKAAVKAIVLYMIDHAPTTIGANRFFLYGVRPGVQNHKPEYFLNGRQYESIWLSS
jgi:peptide/nickel transport system substrate-binding protein